jgi:hypothetical protein
MRALVIDGQGGGVGRMVVENLKKRCADAEVFAVGTNAIATAAMLRAGADVGATGENAVCVHVRRADVVIGPIGIVVADALMGEVSPKMAAAVGASDAEKILIPVGKCGVYVAGTENVNLALAVEDATRAAEKIIAARRDV